MLFPKERRPTLEEWIQAEIGLEVGGVFYPHPHRQWTNFWDMAIERIRSKENIAVLRGVLQEYRELVADRTKQEAKEALKERLKERTEKKRQQRADEISRKLDDTFRRRRELLAQSEKAEVASAIQTMLRMGDTAVFQQVAEVLSVIKEVGGVEQGWDKTEVLLQHFQKATKAGLLLKDCPAEKLAVAKEIFSVSPDSFFGFLQQKVCPQKPQTLGTQGIDLTVVSRVLHQMAREINQYNKSGKVGEDTQFLCSDLDRTEFSKKMMKYSADAEEARHCKREIERVYLEIQKIVDIARNVCTACTRGCQLIEEHWKREKASLQPLIRLEAEKTHSVLGAWMGLRKDIQSKLLYYQGTRSSHAHLQARRNSLGDKKWAEQIKQGLASLSTEKRKLEDRILCEVLDGRFTSADDIVSSSIRHLAGLIESRDDSCTASMLECAAKECEAVEAMLQRTN